MLGPEYRGRSSAYGPNDNYIPDEVVIRFRPNVPPEQRAALLNAHGMRIARLIYGDEAMVVQVGARQALTVANELRNNTLLDAAGVNPIMRSFGNSVSTPAADPEYTTNDPLAPDQIHLDSQFGGINARQAWDYGRGLNQVSLVAIIDTRIDASHEEFEHKRNPENWVSFVSGGTENADIGHGTHVAGVAVADTDNGLGVAGTGFTAWPMSLEIDPSGVDGGAGGEFDRMVSAVNWAADHGASVINISRGCKRDFTNFCNPANTTIKLLRDAIQRAYDRGITIVAAGGNYSYSIPAYPAAFGQLLADEQPPYNWTHNEQLVIAVGGSRNGYREPSASYGPWLDFVAPNMQDNGDGILSTETISAGVGLYGRRSGTSFAAPQVAGLASLLTSLGYSNHEVWQFIKDKATDLPCDVGQPCLGPGYDPYTGWGRVNMGASMALAHHAMGTWGMVVVPNAGYAASQEAAGGQWFNIQGSGFTANLPQPNGVQICLTPPQLSPTCYGVGTDPVGATGLGVQVAQPNLTGLWNVSMCEGVNCTYGSFTVLPGPP